MLGVRQASAAKVVRATWNESSGDRSIFGLDDQCRSSS